MFFFVLLRLYCISILFTTTSIILVDCADPNLKSVTTTFGVIRGETVHHESDDLVPVTQYLGVPYGVAPLDQYRFNMAISAAKWTHMPKDAIRFGAACVQSGLPDMTSANSRDTMSAQRFDHIQRLIQRGALLSNAAEDCLYMNIFVPERIDNKEKKKLPVLVLVHGDEYGWNSANAYNATTLAAYGQIIVVTINYRLGVFGFLGRCETSSCSGNSGLSDIIAALKMLSNTLPAFGGNADLVTLLGWGSGAALVSLLMASPMTQPNNRLFKRAVLLDGSALAPSAIVDNPSPFFYMLADKLDCPTGLIVVNASTPGTNYKRPELQSVESILRCMQTHSADNVTKAARRVHTPTFLAAYAPVVDGQMVPNRPQLSFSEQFGSLFRDIDLMVGTVSHPAHHLIGANDLKNGIDTNKRNKIFRTLVRNLYDYHRQEIFDALINEYTDWTNPHDHPKTTRNSVMDALGDVLYTAPLIDTARLHSIHDANRKQSNTYMFVFAHQTRSRNIDSTASNRIDGAISGDHLPYLLGYPLIDDRDSSALYTDFTDDDRALSKVMMRLLTNFVKSGEPMKPLEISSETAIEGRYRDISWTQYNHHNREPYLEIAERPRMKNYYRNAQVAFWNGFVPQLVATGKEGSIPEQHNFLSNHFSRDSFFGEIRPYGGYSNYPFPPPPLPPTPMPKDALKSTTTTAKPSMTSEVTSSDSSSTIASATAVNAEYSTILSVTVAVGCALLVLNICIFAGIYHQRDKQQRNKKKLQLQYHSYASSGGGAGADINFNLNSPMMAQQHHHQQFGGGTMPPPPPPPPPTSHSPIDYDHHHQQMRPTLAGYNHHHQHHLSSAANSSLPRSYPEQEPLLSKTSAAVSSAGSALIRTGVSPTCPRHGRAAMAIANRANSLVGGGTLEEIQV